MIAIIHRERGIPSNDGSSDRRDYVPALCTHRPSLLPIEQSGEYFGPRPVGATRSGFGKSSKPYCLEEGEVVTRFP